MWRWVRDRRSAGLHHAVPADFEAPAWYSVCLETIDAKTAVEPAQPIKFRTCINCDLIIRQLAKADSGELYEWPRPADLRAEYEAGASVYELGRRHRIGQPTVLYLLSLADTPLRPAGITETERATLIVELLAEEPDRTMCGADIARTLELKADKVYQTLHRLTEDGVLVRCGSKDWRTRPYRLAEASALQARQNTVHQDGSRAPDSDS